MKHKNTMDEILVDYALQDHQSVKKGKSISEFLSIEPWRLDFKSQRMQNALKRLYELNDREPPLFESFPKRPEKPLTIDCIFRAKMKDAWAEYDITQNRVRYSEALLDDMEMFYSLAHELKHAEQGSEELRNITSNSDGLGLHQIGFAEELQAYTFGDYVLYLVRLRSGMDFPLLRFKENESILKKYTDGKNIAHFGDIELEMMTVIAPKVFQYTFLRELYDRKKLVLKKDKGLSELPSSFNFKDPKAVLSLLQKVPRDALTLQDRFFQAIYNSVEATEIAMHMQTGYAHNDAKNIKEALQNKRISKDELLTIMEYSFSKQPITEVHTEQTKKMLEFLLDLEIEGQPLMSGKFISNLLKKSRNDVTEAILDYRKKRPLDHRFSENGKSLSQTLSVSIQKPISKAGNTPELSTEICKRKNVHTQ